MKRWTATARLAMTALAIAVATLTSASAAPGVPAWRLGVPWSTETATGRFANDVIDAQIADTSRLRSRGLGYRDSLPPGTGMLFIYEEPDVLSFWMKGMRICLDIVWIDEGEIKGAAESVCPEPGVPDADLKRYASPVPVRYVLEVPAGWLDQHGYDTGDRVEIDLPGDAERSLVARSSVAVSTRSSRRWLSVTVTSPRVRSSTARSWSVVRRSPPVTASG
ncbi:MAG: DUF192 domain-containing protein [Thermomicrobiales bacterium]|nr:DUF192 domain-containing protein [Thermomicrobiales bacterium]